RSIFIERLAHAPPWQEQDRTRGCRRSGSVPPSLRVAHSVARQQQHRRRGGQSAVAFATLVALAAARSQCQWHLQGDEGEAGQALRQAREGLIRNLGGSRLPGAESPAS